MRILATKERAEMIKALTAIGPNVLEIGVGNSKFSRIILETDKATKLTCIDPFFNTSGVIEGFYNHEQHKVAAETLGNDFPTRHNLIINTSPEGLKTLVDSSFDWIFVDGDHTLEGVLSDLCEAMRLVKPGGVVACHDFAVHDLAKAYRQEVVEGVLSFLEYNDLEFYGLDPTVYPTALLIKQPSATTCALLDDLLSTAIVHKFCDVPTQSNFKFKQSLSHQGDTFNVLHLLTVKDETVVVRTTSTRAFSGYYSNTAVKVSPSLL